MNYPQIQQAPVEKLQRLFLLDFNNFIEKTSSNILFIDY